jgi:hypothetical protein
VIAAAGGEIDFFRKFGRIFRNRLKLFRKSFVAKRKMRHFRAS